MPRYSGPHPPCEPRGSCPGQQVQGRPSHKCFHQLARLNQVPRKRCTAARALLSSRQGGRGGRTWCGARRSGGRAPAPRAGGPQARPEGGAESGVRTRRPRPGLPPPGPAPGPPAWSAGAIYREPADRGQAPLPTSRAGKGTARQPRSGPGPGGARGTEAAASAPPATSDPGLSAAAGSTRGRARCAPGAGAPRWCRAGRAERGGGGRTCWKPGARGDNYLLSGTARGSPGRGSSRARPPRVPRAPSGAASRSAHSADAPQVEQQRSRRRISAPPGAAAAAARSRPPSAPTPRSAATGGAAPGAGLCLFGQGEGSGRGRGEGAGGAGRLAPRLGPRRPPLRPLGHQRGLRGAGGPGAGGWPPRPHESAPPPPPEPRRRQGSDGGPWIAQRPDRRSPVASRRCLPLGAAAALAPARGSGGRAAAAAAAAAENRARGRGCAPGAGPPHHRRRRGPRGRAQPAGRELAWPGGPRTVPASALLEPAPPPRRPVEARPGLPRAACPAGPVAAAVAAAPTGGAGDNARLARGTPPLRPVARARRPIGSVLLGRRREGPRGARTPARARRRLRSCRPAEPPMRTGPRRGPRGPLPPCSAPAWRAGGSGEAGPAENRGSGST